MPKIANRKNQSPNLMLNGIITNPKDWAFSLGYEYWFVPGHADIAAVMSSSNDGLSGFGWAQSVAASGVITTTVGTAGDFLSSSDMTPNHVTGNGNATGPATLKSPPIFGGYEGSLIASRFLGYFPTKLNAEWWGKLAATGHSGDASYFGFALTSSTNSDIGTSAVIRSGLTGSTWVLRKAGISSDNGNATDTSWHKFRIQVDATNTEWWIDDTSQGTITTIADQWPCSFILLNGDVATNGTLALGALRIWYS